MQGRNPRKGFSRVLIWPKTRAFEIFRSFRAAGTSNERPCGFWPCQLFKPESSAPSGILLLGWMSKSKPFGFDFGPFWADFGLTFDRLWADFRPTLGRLLADFGQTLGQLWADFGPTLGRLLANFESNLGRLQADFGSTSGRLLADFGSAFG